MCGTLGWRQDGRAEPKVCCRTGKFQLSYIRSEHFSFGERYSEPVEEGRKGIEMMMLKVFGSKHSIRRTSIESVMRTVEHETMSARCIMWNNFNQAVQGIFRSGI